MKIKLMELLDRKFGEPLPTLAGNIKAKQNEYVFKAGDKERVANIPDLDKDHKRFMNKRGIVLRAGPKFSFVKLKGFKSPEIEFHHSELVRE